MQETACNHDNIAYLRRIAHATPIVVLQNLKEVKQESKNRIRHRFLDLKHFIISQSAARCASLGFESIESYFNRFREQDYVVPRRTKKRNYFKNAFIQLSSLWFDLHMDQVVAAHNYCVQNNITKEQYNKLIEDDMAHEADQMLHELYQAMESETKGTCEI